MGAAHMKKRSRETEEKERENRNNYYYVLCVCDVVELYVCVFALTELIMCL